MALTAGRRLGAYEIVGPLGAGGMGEVYRGRDRRLNRDVAIKVLPEAFAKDAERRARFEREAQSIAALSHPNILAVYDTGEDEGHVYFVSELLDGETLRDRLTSGALPVRRACDVAGQIARGLAAAHAKGIVHRDLKPANVFLLKDGQVKILDFGLARLTSAIPGSGATETAAAVTDPGTVLGTVGYMAPEQIRGQTVDARADLFALGAVLYEMLSGHRAFVGNTAADTMTAILREEPAELSGVHGEALPGLDRLIRHCLEKNPAERFQNAGDVAFALEAFSGTGVGATSGAVPTLSARPSRTRWLVTGVLALAALGAGVVVGRALQPAPTSITFEPKTWDEQVITKARFAPDSQTIVFSAVRFGDARRPRLYAIRQGALTSEPLGEPATQLLSISSKGELAVLTNARPSGQTYSGTLARMTMDGAPRPWLDEVTEADWSPDSSTVAITRWVGDTLRLEYPIGHTLYEVKAGYLSDLRVSPDGTRVAFFEHQIFGDDRGWVKVIGTSGAPRTLAGEYSGLKGLAWSSDGRSVYFGATTLVNEGKQPLVVNVDGTPRPHSAITSAGGMFVEDVAHNGAMLVAREDNRGGIRALVPGEVNERDLSWLNLNTRGFLTSDSKSLIFDDESHGAGPNYAVTLRDLATSRVTRLGEGMAIGLSPDNKWAAALVPSVEQIVLYPIGPGEPIKLPKGPIEHYQSYMYWFPDSKRVFVCGSEAGKGHRCYEQNMEGGPPKPVTPEATYAVLASDGLTVLVYFDRTVEVMRIGERSGRPALGLTPQDYPIGWSSNGRDPVVDDANAEPTRISEVDLSTGARRFIRTIGPPDRPGTAFVSQWIDDGRGYTYTYSLKLSRLFVATGVGR